MASIRSKGKLTKWFDDKGFGFITPEKGKGNVFVHISSFDRNIPRRPEVGDTIFYYVKTDQNGKTKAINAIIEGAAPIEKTSISKPKKKYQKRKSKSSWRFFVIAAVLLIGAGGTVYNRIQSGSKTPSILKQFQNTQTSSAQFSCQGKTHCSQMASCAEAKFYIRNCPGTKMDGDDDGIPCERQLCN